ASEEKGSLPIVGRWEREAYGSCKQQGRQAPTLRTGPGVFKTLRLQKLQEPLPSGAVIPLAVATDDFEEIVGRTVAIARGHLRIGEFQPCLVIVAVRSHARSQARRIDLRSRGAFQRRSRPANLRL